MVKQGFFLFLCCLQSIFCCAQHFNFVESGEIIYEKKVNMHAKIKGRFMNDKVLNSDFWEDYKKTKPQFFVEKKKLLFTADHSFFSSLGTNVQPSSAEAGEPWVVVKNTVATDFEANNEFITKQVFGDEFEIADKKEKILWKYTYEEREIAGYRCKRANGLYRDSVYVVAFYAEDIIPSGGPESFWDLPGMILGVALPHENVSWFATEVTPLTSGEIPKPKMKGKKKPVSKSDFFDQLKETTKNWGSYRTEAIKAFSL